MKQYLLSFLLMTGFSASAQTSLNINGNDWLF